MIEELGGCIDYEERGHGQTIVFVPGSCSTGAAWRPIISELGDSYRYVTTSLLGYGSTAERRTLDAASMSDETEIVETVISRAGCPVHLVGHSFGGLTALAVALRDKTPLLSLTILEAPAAELLRHSSEHKLYSAFRNMTDAYLQALKAGESTAIAQMIDFYGGTGTFASWPQRVRDYAVNTTPANVLDWACAYSFELSPHVLTTLKLPTLVVWGADSHPAVRRANELLALYIQGTSAAMIPNAAHFMTATHPKDTARLISEHLSRL
jgi:pimeloyl-ACP methyl ester carboxylesterase